MSMITKMIGYVIGSYDPKAEIHAVKNDITKQALITNVKVNQVNEMLYDKDTTYHLAKALGVLK